MDIKVLGQIIGIERHPVARWFDDTDNVVIADSKGVMAFAVGLYYILSVGYRNTGNALFGFISFAVSVRIGKHIACGCGLGLKKTCCKYDDGEQTCLLHRFNEIDDRVTWHICKPRCGHQRLCWLQYMLFHQEQSAFQIHLLFH
ncbi:hypothetical protein D3C87_1398380 [compost metagenome]